MKNRHNQKFYKKHGINKPLSLVASDETVQNAYIIGIILLLSLLMLFLASFGHSEERVYKSDTSDIEKKSAKKVGSDKSVYMESGGAAYIDGSLQVFGTNKALGFDLVEVSTPVTPAANHMRLFLRADGTKSSLVAVWDDGSTSRIAGN
jgi:hypothetical protein